MVFKVQKHISFSIIKQANVTNLTQLLYIYMLSYAILCVFFSSHIYNAHAYNNLRIKQIIVLCKIRLSKPSTSERASKTICENTPCIL